MTRIANILAFAVLALGALSACSTPEERTAEYTARAKALYAAGDLDKARIEARNAVQIAPKNAEARYLLALIAEQKGEVAQMLEQLAVVIEEDPKNEGAKVRLGTLMVYAQDYEGANLLADEALALKPDDPAAHVLKARVLMQKEDIPAMLASLDKAIELDPANLDAAALRAVGIALKEPQKALEDLTASIGRVGAKNAEPLRQLRVDLLSRLGRNDEVEQELRALLADFGGDKYYANLALYYTSQNRLDDAEQVLRDAVAADPKSVNAKVSLAQFQSKYRQRPEEAEKTLKDFIAAEPDNAQLSVYLGNFYEGGNRIPEALAAYETAAKADPDSAQGLSARNRIAALKLRSGDVAGASEVLGAILDDEPDNVEALLARGEIHYASGRNDAAIADLRGVLRRAPDNQLALLLLAKTHAAVGDRPLAEDAYRRLLQFAPGNGEALASLATLLAESNQLDEAESLLKQALAANPQNAQALEAMVGLLLAKGDLDGAERQARALAAMDDPNGVGQRELGRALEAAGKLPAATEAYKKALQKKPDSTLALEGVARTLQMAGKLDEAGQFLSAHIEEHPDHVLARVLLGGNYVRAGRLAEARTTLDQAVDQQPQLVRAYIVLAGAYPQDPEARMAAFKRGLEANPTAGDLAVLLASEYQRAGRVDDAIELYEQMLDRKTGMAQIANNLAALLLDFRTDEASHKRALEIAQRFANSQQPMFLDTLGWAHYRNKDYDAAIRFLELAVAYGRSEPEARYHLAQAYLATDNKVGAKQELEKALKESEGRAPWAAEAKKTLDSLAAAPAAASQG